MPISLMAASRLCRAAMMTLIATHSMTLHAEMSFHRPLVEGEDGEVMQWLYRRASSSHVEHQFKAMMDGDPAATQSVMKEITTFSQTVKNREKLQELGHDNIIATIRVLLRRAARHQDASPEMLMLAAKWHRAGSPMLARDEASAYDLMKKAREKGYAVDDLTLRKIGEYSERLPPPFRAELVCGDHLPIQRCHTSHYERGDIMMLQGIYSHGRQYRSGHPGRPTFSVGALTSDFIVELFNGSSKGDRLTMNVFFEEGGLYAKASAAPGEALRLTGPGFQQ